MGSLSVVRMPLVGPGVGRGREHGVRVAVMSAPPASKRAIRDVRDVMSRRKRLEMTDRPLGGEVQMAMMGT